MFRHFLVLAPLLAAGLPNALCRAFRESTSTSAVSSPSPLLNAQSADGWQPVPGGQPATDGTSTRPRIINGDMDSQWKLFPYVAYITWRFNATARFLCSGSLIGPSHILTAAHCLESEGRYAQPDNLGINLRGVWLKAAAVHVHSGWNRLEGPLAEPSNDIGIIALARPCSGPTVSLPKPTGGGLLGGALAAAAIPAANDKVWAAGYGQTETSESSDVLRYTDLRVYAQGEAERGFADDFAAGGPSGKTCHGDSGGPIIRPGLAGDVVVGITSFGSADCSKDYSFFVRTAYHLSWIDTRMELPIPAASGGLPGGSGGPGPGGILTPVKDWLNALP